MFPGALDPRHGALEIARVALGFVDLLRPVQAGAQADLIGFKKITKSVIQAPQIALQAEAHGMRGQAFL